MLQRRRKTATWSAPGAWWRCRPRRWDFCGRAFFSFRAKLALLGEPWRARSPAAAEESVAQFVERRLGREFLDYAVNPLVGGVYAGDPRRLSVRHAFPKLHALEQKHGSLLRGALRQRNTSGGPKGRIFSFPDGLEELPRALAAALGGAMRLSDPVEVVRRTRDGWEIVTAAGGGNARRGFFRRRVRAPGRRAGGAALRGRAGGRTAGGLARDRAAAGGLGLHRVSPGRRGASPGRLRTARARGGAAADPRDALLQHAVSGAGRPPATSPSRRSSAGARSPELAGLDSAALGQLVRGELGALLGVRGVPVCVGVRRHPRAIPQYALGHARFQGLAAAAAETSAPGLFIGGNARDGISLAYCIESGRRLAQAVTGLPAAGSRPIFAQ
jgi:oxygen-dependent protoporphyrinogen oxidase